MQGVGLIDQAGADFQAKEAVRVTCRDVHDVVVRCGKLEANRPPECRRCLPKIEQHIMHSTAEAIDQFLVRVRWDLEMHATQDTGDGSGKKLLANDHVDIVGCELILVKRLHESSSRIFEDKGPEDFDPGQRLGNKIHGNKGHRSLTLAGEFLNRLDFIIEHGARQPRISP